MMQTETRMAHDSGRSDARPARGREFWLLLLAFTVLGLGYAVVWQDYLPIWKQWYHGQDWRIFLAPAGMLAAWLCLSGVLTARRCRETLLLPTVALLVGIGLLFLLRLAGGAATLELTRSVRQGAVPLGPLLFTLYQKQLFSLGVGWVALMGLALCWKDYRALARYKYLIAAVAVGLLLVTTIFGHAVNDQQLTLRILGIAFQPHDPVKLLLVIFMAAYLVEKKELLSFAAGRYGVLTLMDLRYMGPLVTLWLMVMAIVFVHKDLGAALLLFGAFLGMLYLGTERKSFVTIGVILFLVGMLGAYHFVGRVQTRVAIWENPWRYADNRGYQICQALMALGNGRVVGAGLGGGYPERIPAVETDMIYAAISEDLGLVGAVALIGLFLVVISRAYHVAFLARDRFGQLAAAGLATALAVQTWVILAGVVKLIPLTGITLPFISYGGTSLVMNLLLVGIVLKIAEQPTA